ncbi:DUF885 family protein [Streptomyces sp. ODS28]|uniref:DUF885 family protein n=1 Tax=Streptomyces sp. ODS28 TaxID=3136688 RepID=UPI0031EC0FA0
MTGGEKSASGTAYAEELVGLSEEFRRWRTASQADSHDDVPRVARPEGWVADWSAEAVEERRRRLAEFAARHRALELGGEPVAVQVDGRLLGAALDKVHWELDMVRGWQRNPCFYLDQALVAVYELLLEPPPFGPERAAAVLRHLRQVPEVLRQARANLAEHAAAPFAAYARRLLDRGPEDVRRAMAALAPLLPAPYAAELPALAEETAGHLAAFRAWLEGREFGGTTAIGTEALAFYLHRVALLPYGPEQLRAHARGEYARAVALEESWRSRAPGRESAGAGTLVERQAVQEAEVRGFCAERGLLRLPADLRRYRFAPMPPYLAPLTWLGVPHYLASPEHAREDAVRYVPEPGPGLSYFEQAKVLDPRTGIVHEGVHAHQLALSWQHSDPVRRHFHDSVPNEGLAFHHEELTLTAGLFDDAPASGAFLANSMRLRALRVDVDLGLALGDLALEEAAAQLAERVPVDHATAWQEAVLFSAAPGQGLSYQAGKTQILDLLAAAREEQGDAFDLAGFHDRLWREGNVPLALQRWELLGRSDHVEEAGRLAGRAAV